MDAAMLISGFVGSVVAWIILLFAVDAMRPIWGQIFGIS
jgi:hypothetical protein